MTTGRNTRSGATSTVCGPPLNPVRHLQIPGIDAEEPAVAAIPVVTHQGNYLVAWQLHAGTDHSVYVRSVEIASDGTATLGTAWPGAIFSHENGAYPAAGGSGGRGNTW